MHIELTNLSETKIKLLIRANAQDLQPFKQRALSRLAKDVKLPGFRSGKAPLNMVEKNIDTNLLHTEFLDEAMSSLYSQAATEEKIRPVNQPQVSMKKFVPFSELEFEITTEIVGKIKLADYKTIRQPKPEVEISAKDVQGVIDSLKLRAAGKKEVDRAAKDTDELLIDFKGVDEADKPVNGAEGTDYPLVLGSNTFIPGFEDNLIGLKGGEEKTFVLTFPKDYGVSALANKKVKFTVTVKKVQEISEPEVNDEFASKVGPFQTLKDLKADIKKQLGIEKQAEAGREYANTLVQKIADKSTVSLPESMIQQQASHLLEEFKRNLAYRGQTLQEFFDSEKTTEEKYLKEVLSPQAEKQVKASLILAEIAQAEDLHVTPEELEIRMQILKGQYKDAQMQAELDKPEARQDIASRMLTDKVLAKLEEYATQTT